MILTTFSPSFLPVMRELKSLGIISLHPQFTKMLNDIDIDAKSFSDLVEPDIRENGKGVAAVTLLEYFQYEFLGELSEKRREFLLSKLPGYFYGRLDDIFTIVLALDKVHPSLIIVHNDVEPINRTLALWAKSRKVPCLHIPHAVYLDHGGRGVIGSDVHDIITASDIVCNGPFQTNWYAERGADINHLYPIGLPQFDRLAVKKFSRNQACRVLGQVTNRPIITYMSSWRQDTNLLGCHNGVEESYTEFLEIASRLPEVQFIIKCHPHGNNVDWHKKLATEKGIRCIIMQDHLDPILAASDLIISYGASNVMLEAATYAHTRLMVVGDESAFCNDPEIRICMHGNLEDDIKKSLSNGPPDYTKFLDKYFAAIDGNNYLRIAKLAKYLHG